MIKKEQEVAKVGGSVSRLLRERKVESKGTPRDSLPHSDARQQRATAGKQERSERVRERQFKWKKEGGASGSDSMTQTLTLSHTRRSSLSSSSPRLLTFASRGLPVSQDEAVEAGECVSTCGGVAVR